MRSASKNARNGQTQSIPCRHAWDHAPADRATLSPVEPPLTASFAFPFFWPLWAGFPLQIALHHREKVLGRLGHWRAGSPQARPRPPAVIPCSTPRPPPPSAHTQTWNTYSGYMACKPPPPPPLPSPPSIPSVGGKIGRLISLKLVRNKRLRPKSISYESNQHFFVRY